MKIKALAPWFGSKRNLAVRIVEALGSHRAYWEPFCGSMAVLLNKPAVGQEYVNDLHGDLVNLARVVREEPLAVELHDRLVRTLFCEALLADSAAVVTGSSAVTDRADLDRAYHYFVYSWMGRNGVSGSDRIGTTFARRFTSLGGQAAKRFASAVDSLPEWHRRLRHVNILCADAFELLPRIEDAAGTAMYVDPPYLEKGAKYVHDFDPADHARLAGELARFTKTRVVVSYYDHPALVELYPPDRWERTRIEVSKAMASAGKRDAANEVRAVEVLLTNQRGGLFG